MRPFRNFKEAHQHYKYPSTYRIGTIYNATGVIRSYSNGTKDIQKDNYKRFYYKIENDNVKLAFRNSIDNRKPLRLFVNMGDFVIDFGMYTAERFYKEYVKLVPVKKN